MNKKTNISLKQMIPLIFFSIIFFVCMIVLLSLFGQTAKEYDRRKLENRLEFFAVNEKVVGNDSCLRELISEHDYEKEFDRHWEYANVRLAYINARFGTKKPESIETIRAYANGSHAKARVETAKEYLQKLEE